MALVFGTIEIVLIESGQFSTLLAPIKKITEVRIFFLLYLSWSILSGILSPYNDVWIGQGRFEGLCEILLCVLVFWAVSSYGKWDNRFFWLLGVVILLNTVIGLIQYAGGNPLKLFPEGTNYHDAFVIYNGQFMGTLGNVDILSAFLCLTMPIFYAAYLHTDRILTLIPLGAGAFLLALSDVDAGYVGIAAALFLTFPLYYTKRSAWGRGLISAGILMTGLGIGRMLYADRDTALCLRTGKLGIWLLLLGVLLAVLGILLCRRGGSEKLSWSHLLWIVLPVGLLAGFAVLYFAPFSGGTLWEIQQVLHGNFDSDFGSGRVRIWKEVLRLMKERPLLGGGPDTLKDRVTFTFTRYSKELDMTIEAYVDAAHNLFLNTAVNQGIPALAFWLAGLGAWLVEVLKHRSTAGPFLLAGVVGYLAQGFFNVSLCSVTGLFWIFLALGECDTQFM